MISRGDLRNLARARLKDAELLLESNRYDGAAYLCGYAIELALKARICRLLKWEGFPETSKEFENFRSFRTHDLEVLLRLSGLGGKIKTQHFTELGVTRWNQFRGWPGQLVVRVPKAQAAGDRLGFSLTPLGTIINDPREIGRKG